MVMYLVNVGLARGVITGVKIRRDVDCTAHRDVVREQAIQPSYQRRRGDTGGGIEVRYLCQRVHAGIGASGAVQAHGAVRDP